MVSETVVYACPACGLSEPIIRHGTNRGGTARLRGRVPFGRCGKTFTPKPNPRRVTEEMEERMAALHSTQTDAGSMLSGMAGTVISPVREHLQKPAEPSLDNNFFVQ